MLDIYFHFNCVSTVNIGDNAGGEAMHLTTAMYDVEERFVCPYGCAQ